MTLALQVSTCKSRNVAWHLQFYGKRHSGEHSSHYYNVLRRVRVRRDAPRPVTAVVLETKWALRTNQLVNEPINQPICVLCKVKAMCATKRKGSQQRAPINTQSTLTVLVPSCDELLEDKPHNEKCFLSLPSARHTELSTFRVRCSL